ncbi:methionyl-tRNA formyltransferase [Lysobacteraceae bacterium NML95-0200]|nr:methionyl-tRNA formyltransferase [Xanthomonadaceae bacterium NML95-0200]
MKIVFAGTPEFAVPCFHAAREKAEVLAVFTQPDRPAGRGRGVQMSPVKQAALVANVPVHQPETLRSPEAQALLRELAPDLMVVVAYGLILPQAVLDIPVHGCWNVHASLLPRWRGAAPIQRAIEAGDSQTGVCLMRMQKGLDTGPVMLQLDTAISDTDTGGSLHDRLAVLGAQVLRDGLGLLRVGLLPSASVQGEEGITYAHKLDKAEARLDWQQPAVQLARKVRAFHPWPVAEALLEGERTRIHEAQAVASDGGHAPGSIIRAARDGIDVATGEGALRILRLQREGGRPITAADWLNARKAQHAS